MPTNYYYPYVVGRTNGHIINSIFMVCQKNEIKYNEQKKKINEMCGNTVSRIKNWEKQLEINSSVWHLCSWFYDHTFAQGKGAGCAC